MGKSKIYRSLSLRVAFVFVVMIIFPLLLYVFFLWNKDWKIKLDGVFSEMELIGDFSRIALEDWYEDSLILLNTIPFLEKDLPNVELAKNLSALFTFNRDFECTSSTQKSLVGRKDLFAPYLQKAFAAKTLFFVDENPATKKMEIFLFERRGENLVGLSADLEEWASAFSSIREIGYPSVLSFISPQKKILFSVGPIPSLNKMNLHMWTFSELKLWQKKTGVWEWAKLRGKDFFLVLTVPNAAFDMGIFISAAQIEGYEGGGFFRHVLILLSLLILIGGVGAFWIIIRISRPLRQLYFVMDEVSHQNYQQRYQTDRYGFEINILGENFNHMITALLQNKERAENERVSREVLSKELQIGRSVQQELLPKQIPEFPGLSLGTGFQPAKEVAGDFYDLIALDEKHLFLAIADASDKGVSACLYSLIVRSMLRSHLMAGENLKEIIRKTNDLFCKDTGYSGNFVTAWLGLFEVETRKLHYHCSGHLPAVVVHSDGNTEELLTEGIALGVKEGNHIEIKSISLQPRSLICLYSDGITEAHNEKGELFGKSRLLDFLRCHRDLEAQALIDRLIAEIHQFAGDLAQHDDLTIVCINVH